MKSENVIEENLQAVKEDVHFTVIETNPGAEKEVEDILKNTHENGTDRGIEIERGIETDKETEIDTDITDVDIKVRHFLSCSLNYIIATFNLDCFIQNGHED